MEEEIRRQRFTTFAKWVKEIALLLLAALVVQNIVSGASFSDASVFVGLVTSPLLYALAVFLMYKK